MIVTIKGKEHYYSTYENEFKALMHVTEVEGKVREYPNYEMMADFLSGKYTHRYDKEVQSWYAGGRNNGD